MNNRTAAQMENILEQGPEGAYFAIGRRSDIPQLVAILLNREREELGRTYGRTLAEAIDSLELMIFPAQAEESFVQSPIGYYVSEEDAEKFDRLLSDPFGRS